MERGCISDKQHVRLRSRHVLALALALGKSSVLGSQFSLPRRQLIVLEMNSVITRRDADYAAALRSALRSIDVFSAALTSKQQSIT